MSTHGASATNERMRVCQQKLQNPKYGYTTCPSKYLIICHFCTSTVGKIVEG